MKDVFETYQKANDIINVLRQKSISVPTWESLLKDYDPKNHDVVNDTVRIRDRELEDGVTENASRIAIGLEQLLVSRYVDFTFAIPVHRVYHNVDNEKDAEFQKIMEAIYKHARIDNENIKRGRAYYASCEFCTIWYTVKQENSIYGFSADSKLKCKTYSPMNGVKLYPLFDELDDLYAMSFEYKQKVGTDEVTYFETYTADKRAKWKQNGGDWEQVEIEGVTILNNPLRKIPGVYGARPESIYTRLAGIRSEMEYTLSQNSNIISYNAAPVLKVAGAVSGHEKKDEGYRVIRVENGGDVSYVSWNQGIDSLKYQVDNLLKFYFMQAQMPDISAEKMMSLGNIGFDARQTILMDAHLKVGEESGFWVEIFEREANVLKAYVKMMRQDLADAADKVEIEHVITPYIQNDEKAEIQKWVSACGGKAVMSQLSAIKNAGFANDPQEELDQIYKEEEQEQSAKMESVFGGGSAA